MKENQNVNFDKRFVKRLISLTGALVTVGRTQIGLKLATVLLLHSLEEMGKVEFSMQSLKICVKGSTHTS